MRLSMIRELFSFETYFEFLSTKMKNTYSSKVCLRMVRLSRIRRYGRLLRNCCLQIHFALLRKHFAKPECARQMNIDARNYPTIPVISNEERRRRTYNWVNRSLWRRYLETGMSFFFCCYFFFRIFFAHRNYRKQLKPLTIENRYYRLT